MVVFLMNNSGSFAYLDSLIDVTHASARRDEDNLFSSPASSSSSSTDDDFFLELNAREGGIDDTNSQDLFMNPDLSARDFISSSTTMTTTTDDANS